MLERICNALAMTCRFGGDVKRHYSIAEHTVHMVRQAQENGETARVQMMMWLHDVPEWRLGDLLPPVKTNPEIAKIYADMETATIIGICRELDIGRELGLTALQNSVVKEYDQAILAAEAVTVAHPQPNWNPFDPCKDMHAEFQARIDGVTNLKIAVNEPWWKIAMMDEFHRIQAELSS